MKPSPTPTRTLRTAVLLSLPLAAAVPAVGLSNGAHTSALEVSERLGELAISAVGDLAGVSPSEEIGDVRLEDARLAVALPPARDHLWVRVRQPVALPELARQLKLPSRTLADLNEVRESHSFRKGDWLMLPSQQGRYAKQLAMLDGSELRRSQPPLQAPPPIQTSGVVKLGDTLLQIAQRYGTTMQEIIRLNPGLDTARLVAGTEIKLVQSAPPRQRAILGLRPSASGGLSWPDQPNFGTGDQGGTDAGAQSWIWPTTGVFTSGYGWRWGRMHRGIDVANNVGTPIMAARTGRVVFSGWHDGGYGYLVTLQHPDGSRSLYAHNSRLMVSSGQEVRQGHVIALMGSTGRSTGPHLHFEIHPAGAGATNPLGFLPPRA